MTRPSVICIVTISLKLKTSNKNYDADLKIKLYKKIIHAFPYVKYFSVFSDKNLNWKTQINKVLTRLIKINAILSKFRHFVNRSVFLSVYDAIFHSHLAYLSLAKGSS